MKEPAFSLSQQTTEAKSSLNLGAQGKMGAALITTEQVSTA